METRRSRHRRASTPFPLLLFKPVERRESSFPKIFVGPGIRPLESPVAAEIRELLSPN